jgi:pimeloyl-ACP methyl ester carboxylesterase
MVRFFQFKRKVHSMPFAINQGVKIYWDEAGQGDPILLIMGLGYTSDAWYRIRTVLSPKYRTIALDNRGVGRSDLPPGPYPIALMASDAAVVLDAAGAQRAHVFGISMGGMIAQEFALQYPARVRSLILGCTTAGGPNSVPAAAESVELLMSRANMTLEDAARAAVPFIYDAATPRERIEQDLAIRRPWYPRPEAYLAQLQGILTWESFSRLSDIKAPTLVIHGESDLLIPAGNAKLLAEKIPGAKLVLLPHASHIFPTDQPELTHRAILNFLENQTPPIRGGQ